MSTETNLKQAFANALGVSADRITDDLAYQGIPEWDSVSHMVLISELESAFDVSIDTDDVIDLSSVGKAKEILRKYHIEI
ncbi:MAG: acyl carrier protein [Bacteroidetes bacterium]|nr:acyl carrier protein [Bacteroidota bacterium]